MAGKLIQFLSILYLFGKTLFFNADILENKVNINSNLLKVYSSVKIKKFNNFISNGAPPFM